jgi:hypothetical protein
MDNKLTVPRTIVPTPEEAKDLNLMEIEQRMLQKDQVDIPVTHTFSGGVYIRQVDIPAGVLVMGKRHRFETCNILLKGVLLVYIDENKPPIKITGPAMFTSAPGAKKFAYCQEDAVFINVIPTKLTDPDEIERQFIIPEQEYLEQKGDLKCLS